MNEQQTLFDEQAIAAIDAETVTATETDRPKTPPLRWQWQRPYLCADGRVWVHVGYGAWKRMHPDTTMAKAHREWMQNRSAKSRAGHAHRLRAFLTAKRKSNHDTR